MGMNEIRNRIIKIKHLLEDLRNDIEDDIFDLEQKLYLYNIEEEKYEFLNGLRQDLEDAEKSLSGYE